MSEASRKGGQVEFNKLVPLSEYRWEIPAVGLMRVPAVVFGDRELVGAMDQKVREQIQNVAALPGIVKAAFAMPDAHWGYGFPIGGVAAFDPLEGGVVSAGGVGFDISCGVRMMRTGVRVEDVRAVQAQLAKALAEGIPAGVGSRGDLRLTDGEMEAMLVGGALWAVERGYGEVEDLARIEEGGVMAGAEPDAVSAFAKERQRQEMGTLGSGNHYLEVQQVVEVMDVEAARVMGLSEGEVVVSIHCGSRGLGHQTGTEYLKEMVVEGERHGTAPADRELACAPIDSGLGRRYLGAMRAAINCALANRQMLTYLTRLVFSELLPEARLELIYDVSHNTCKAEVHEVDGMKRELYVHRKGATRAWGPGHRELPEALRPIGQPVWVGGTMGTASYVMVGTEQSERLAFGSSCHGAGRRMSRHEALRTWSGRAVVEELARGGVVVKSPSERGVAEEAPGAYKDVREVVEAADGAGLSRTVARLEPLICIKG